MYAISKGSHWFYEILYEVRAINVAVLYENYTTLSILSLTTRKSFSRPTAVPVFAFPSLHRIKVPNVANNDTEDINVKHSNFKTILRNKTKTPQLFFCTLVVIRYPITTCPLRGLLFNVTYVSSLSIFSRNCCYKLNCFFLLSMTNRYLVAVANFTNSLRMVA